MKFFSKIRHNARAHDRVAPTYESTHGEIFNTVEQQRLRNSLSAAAGIGSSAGERRALDVGCGSGNLTSHLLDLGFRVTAADVSPRFLELVSRKFSDKRGLETSRINGKDLSPFPDGTFQMTAAYSVLHHVPDYLWMVREMARVTASGGVIYIDHENSPSYWEPSEAYSGFMKETRKPEQAPPLTRFFRLSTYINKARQILDPRFIAEGDIHVWPDDHIEWDAIEDVLKKSGFEVSMREDYLLFRRGYSPEVYDKYKNACSDIRMLVARKL